MAPESSPHSGDTTTSGALVNKPLALRAAEMLTAALPEVVAVYRFGSHGTADERPDSDIDLAILCRGPIDTLRTWNVAQELAIKLGRHVDLIDLAAASTVFQAQIVSTGERIVCTDAGFCDAYEVYIMSAYARLNEERKEILDDVLTRGTVHGG